MKLAGVLLLGVIGLVACGSAGEDPMGTASEAVSDGNEGNPHIRQASKTSSTSGPLPLVDRGGDVLAHSNTYAIWWGPQASFPSDEMDGVHAVLGGFGGSSYLATANQYMRAPATSPTTSYLATSVYSGAAADKFIASAPPKAAPKASTLGAEVCSLYGTPDANGIYFFFTSNYPNINYCAWHDKATCNGVTFQVAYMPNMANVSGCSPLPVKNLHCNDYSEATQSLLDGMAHEFMEATTDPHIDAWLDKSGQEVGDKCNFVYGSCVSLPSGDGGTTSWQLQEEWSNATGGCVQTTP
jgi:hypothetical protein